MSKTKSKPADLPEAAFLGMPEKITALLKAESDRGAILILGAYLEEILGFIVRGVCVSNDIADSLLQLRRPAGDFDSRILLCEALALIHPDEASGLRAVQKIRNGAAHFDRKGRGFDVLFDSQSTCDQVVNLCAALNLRLHSREARAVRESFIVASRLLALRLWIRLNETQRPTQARTVSEIADGIREQMKDSPLGKVFSAAEQQAKEGAPESLFELMVTINDALGKTLKQRVSERDHSN